MLQSQPSYPISHFIRNLLLVFGNVISETIVNVERFFFVSYESVCFNVRHIVTHERPLYMYVYISLSLYLLVYNFHFIYHA